MYKRQEQRAGPEGMKELIGGMRATFPDLRVTVDDMIAEGDKVVTRWTGIGTHQGEFLGLPASQAAERRERWQAYARGVRASEAEQAELLEAGPAESFARAGLIEREE